MRSSLTFFFAATLAAAATSNDGKRSAPRPLFEIPAFLKEVPDALNKIPEVFTAGANGGTFQLEVPRVPFVENLINRNARVHSRNSSPAVQEEPTQAIHGQEYVPVESFPGTNERGQFLTVEDYAAALANTSGLPYSTCLRFAMATKQIGRTAIMLQNAWSDLLATAETMIPDPVASIEPAVAGMDAIGMSITDPTAAAFIPVVTSGLDLVAAGLHTIVTLPHEAALEAKRYELEAVKDLIEAASPVQLTNDNGIPDEIMNTEAPSNP